jgi:riboflavin synthase
MFTGLIEHIGTVRSTSVVQAGRRIVIACETLPASDVRVGDSIAIDGCCLTVAAQPTGLARGCELAFDVIPQTLSLTTLGSFASGQRVHMEPALTLASRLGGHMVQGHVDCVGSVLAIQTQGQWRLRVSVPTTLMGAVVAQGSVALAGVSLTIAACGDGRDEASSWLEVALIPTTLEKTTLASLHVGSSLNIECDMVAKQIVAVLERMGARLVRK